MAEDKVTISTAEASDIASFIKMARFGKYGELSEGRLQELASMERQLFGASIQPIPEDTAYKSMKINSWQKSTTKSSKRRRINWPGKENLFKMFVGQTDLARLYDEYGMSDRADADFNDYWNTDNPIFNFFNAMAQECLFESKRVAYGMGSKYTNYASVKLRTGLLASSLRLVGPSKNEYYDFYIETPDYYRFIASGRKWNPGGHSFKVVRIPIRDVYNRTPRDERIAARTGGYTFRRLTQEVLENGSKPSPFIDSIISTIWEEKASILDNIINEEVVKYEQLIRTRYRW
jgi:hypothetical protein